MVGTLQGCTAGVFLYPGAPAGAKSSAFKEFLILPENKILALDDNVEPLALGPLQNLMGIAEPQVEGWKEAELRKHEEAKKKAHEATIISWNAHWKSVGSRKD